jgi:hypothetical protein
MKHLLTNSLRLRKFTPVDALMLRADHYCWGMMPGFHGVFAVGFPHRETAG